ncbi:hypothetical protein [Oryzobacter telluris]|uniref:hypothetical protein n=1 Tax=Oryzobacter telluris TaxID=3149179 RepID=UPI00370D8272
MRRATAVGAVVLLLGVGGCGARVEVLGIRFGSECPVVARPMSTLAVTEEEATVHLWVSNQSFEEPDVELRVSVDGEVVAEQVFDVCGQHMWVPFPLALEPGWHDLVATTPGGLRVEGRVEVPEMVDPSAVPWVVVSHWTQDSPHVSVDVGTGLIGFA